VSALIIIQVLSVLWPLSLDVIFISKEDIEDDSKSLFTSMVSDLLSSHVSRNTPLSTPRLKLDVHVRNVVAVNSKDYSKRKTEGKHVEEFEFDSLFDMKDNGEHADSDCVIKHQ